MFPGQASIVKEKDIVKGMPVNYLRGASWRDEIVIADESQNFTFKELTTLMTRLGEGSKLIICGDPMQSDINGKSGFAGSFAGWNFVAIGFVSGARTPGACVSIWGLLGGKLCVV